ncbi:hypothetical protein DFH06DRAFT_1151157 [Mycena polygramma]|nr:hypothetical protein DFH06DRAFT_1151157 [Mycena polygramma]
MARVSLCCHKFLANLYFFPGNLGGIYNVWRAMKQMDEHFIPRLTAQAVIRAVSCWPPQKVHKKYYMTLSLPSCDGLSRGNTNPDGAVMSRHDSFNSPSTPGRCFTACSQREARAAQPLPRNARDPCQTSTNIVNLFILSLYDHRRPRRSARRRAASYSRASVTTGTLTIRGGGRLETFQMLSTARDDSECSYVARRRASALQRHPPRRGHGIPRTTGAQVVRAALHAIAHARASLTHGQRSRPRRAGPQRGPCYCVSPSTGPTSALQHHGGRVVVVYADMMFSRLSGGWSAPASHTTQMRNEKRELGMRMRDGCMRKRNMRTRWPQHRHQRGFGRASCMTNAAASISLLLLPLRLPRQSQSPDERKDSRGARTRRLGDDGRDDGERSSGLTPASSLAPPLVLGGVMTRRHKGARRAEESRSESCFPSTSAPLARPALLELRSVRLTPSQWIGRLCTVVHSLPLPRSRAWTRLPAGRPAREGAGASRRRRGARAFGGRLGNALPVDMTSVPEAKAGKGCELREWMRVEVLLSCARASEEQGECARGTDACTSPFAEDWGRAAALEPAMAAITGKARSNGRSGEATGAAHLSPSPHLHPPTPVSTFQRALVLVLARDAVLERYAALLSSQARTGMPPHSAFLLSLSLSHRSALRLRCWCAGRPAPAFSPLPTTLAAPSRSRSRPYIRRTCGGTSVTTRATRGFPSSSHPLPVWLGGTLRRPSRAGKRGAGGRDGCECDGSVGEEAAKRHGAEDDASDGRRDGRQRNVVTEPRALRWDGDRPGNASARPTPDRMGARVVRKTKLVKGDEGGYRAGGAGTTLRRPTRWIQRVAARTRGADGRHRICDPAGEGSAMSEWGWRW